MKLTNDEIELERKAEEKEAKKEPVTSKVAAPSKEKEPEPVQPKAIEDVEEIKSTAGEKWLSKLKAGLSKSRNQFVKDLQKSSLVKQQSMTY